MWFTKDYILVAAQREGFFPFLKNIKRGSLDVKKRTYFHSGAPLWSKNGPIFTLRGGALTFGHLYYTSSVIFCKVFNRCCHLIFLFKPSMDLGSKGKISGMCHYGGAVVACSTDRSIKV